MALNQLSEAFYFPESMVVEVLSRLPVKSLLRFKCVCKSWYILITSPEFVSTHLTNYASTYHLVRRFNAIPDGRQIVSLFSPTMNANSSAMDLEIPPLVTNHGIFHYLRVYGTCNGIVCLGRRIDQIALWNPATKEFKIVPRSNISRPSNVEEMYITTRLGFGFDAKTNDYKILQTVTFDEFDAQFELYSLRSNSWKKLEQTSNVRPSSELMGARSLSFTNYRIICWLALDQERGLWEIVSFNMSNEKFDIIKLPLNIATFDDDDHERRLFQFRESIAVIYHQPYVCLHIWVGENFSASGPDSWSKMLSITTTDYLRPLEFCEDGRLLLYHKSKDNMVVYDPLTQETESFELNERVMPFPAFAFKESLISISLSDFQN